jgi:hypothetical protein
VADDTRRLRTGTHRAGNIYWADTDPGQPGDGGQVGYIRIGTLAQAMVDAYNATLADRRPEPVSPREVPAITARPVDDDDLLDGLDGEDDLDGLDEDDDEAEPF